MDVTFEPWSSKRTTILSSYTTSERIPITTVSCKTWRMVSSMCDCCAIFHCRVSSLRKKELNVSLWVGPHGQATPTTSVGGYVPTLTSSPECGPSLSLSVETKAQAAASDKVRHRLEQLDDLEEGSVKETLNLSQKEYVRKIDDLNRALVAAWDNDQRVKALKIAIQV